jgi:dipeptidyl aminopeptidase/acylaminoacyl peptidase
MADNRLAAAIDNWAPRFTANGVDPADFLRITAAIDHWDDWCAEWSRAAAQHEELGRTALAQGRRRSAGQHLTQASVCYHFAKFLFVHDLAQLRAAHRRAVVCLTDALPLLTPPGQRVEIPFDGATLPAILRRPPGACPAPVVVLIPGLDSAKEEFRRTEQLFLDQGLATFSVDGPGQGEAEYDLAIRPDWEIPGAAILDAVAALPGIDPGRIGVWGVSLGGYYAARLACGDGRVRACITLSGPYSFGAAWDQLPGLTREAFTVRARAASAAQARALAAELTLAGRASQLTAPLLVVAGRQDRLFDWRQAQQLAEEAAGPTELLLLADGNHGCANVTGLHRPYSADWMARMLRA